MQTGDFWHKAPWREQHVTSMQTDTTADHTSHGDCLHVTMICQVSAKPTSLNTRTVPTA
jgi:hypothetical protein